MTAIMANSKNSEHVCPLCNLKFNNGTAFKHHMKSHDDNEELREQRNAVLGEMIATCFSKKQIQSSTTDESVFRELVFRGRSGFRGLRFLIREFSRAKRIWI